MFFRLFIVQLAHVRTRARKKVSRMAEFHGHRLVTNSTRPRMEFVTAAFGGDFWIPESIGYEYFVGVIVAERCLVRCRTV